MPVFQDDEGDTRLVPINIKIKESASGGDSVGGPVAAIDDDGDTITYMISALVQMDAVDTGSENDDTTDDVDESMDFSAVATTGNVTDAEGDVDLFTIDRRTGQITVRPGKSVRLQRRRY